MTIQEYENRVKLELYNHFKDSRDKDYIDSEIEKEKDWFYSYYYDTQKENWKYDDEYAIKMAVANFIMWL